MVWLSLFLYYFVILETYLEKTDTSWITQQQQPREMATNIVDLVCVWGGYASTMMCVVVAVSTPIWSRSGADCIQHNNAKV